MFFGFFSSVKCPSKSVCIQHVHRTHGLRSKSIFIFIIFFGDDNLTGISATTSKMRAATCACTYEMSCGVNVVYKPFKVLYLNVQIWIGRYNSAATEVHTLAAQISSKTTALAL